MQNMFSHYVFSLRNYVTKLMQQKNSCFRIFFAVFLIPNSFQICRKTGTKFQRSNFLDPNYFQICPKIGSKFPGQTFLVPIYFQIYPKFGSKFPGQTFLVPIYFQICQKIGSKNPATFVSAISAHFRHKVCKSTHSRPQL